MSTTNNRAVIDGFCTNIPCLSPTGTCRSLLRNCPYHEIEKRISYICSNILTWTNEAELILNLDYLKIIKKKIRYR